MTSLLFWGLVGLGRQRHRPLLLALGTALAAWSVAGLGGAPLLAARIAALHLLAAAAALRHSRSTLAFLVLVLFLASNAWQAAEYSCQDSLSGWASVLVAALGLVLMERSAPATLLLLGAGWLLLGWLELEATPGWLRPPPLAFPGGSPPVPFRPLALGLACLVCGLAATRTPKPWLAAIVLLAPWLAPPETPGPGSVLSPRQVAALLPPERRTGTRLLAARIPQIEAELEVLPEPAWMACSNNPENIRRFEGEAPLLLLRETLPAGPGRLFVSHFNTSGRRRDLVLAFRNRDRTARLVFRRFSALAGLLLPEPGLELWRRYRTSSAGTLELRPGESAEKRIAGFMGNGLVMADLELDRPLELTVALTSPGFQGALEGEVQPRTGTQSRGLFPAPDRRLRARVLLDRGPRLLTLDREWLSSPEGDVLAGNYGAITTVELELVTGDCERCAVVLVPTGGWAGALWEGRLRSIHAFGGLVLHNGKAPGRLRWKHTLTANSYAPTHLLVVPYR